jgi:hypothetical protein
MKTNAWTHLSFVSDPVMGTVIYANGTAVETNAATINLPMNILGVRENGFDHLQGQVDETATTGRGIHAASTRPMARCSQRPSHADAEAI